MASREGRSKRTRRGTPSSDYQSQRPSGDDQTVPEGTETEYQSQYMAVKDTDYQSQYMTVVDASETQSQYMTEREETPEADYLSQCMSERDGAESECQSQYLSGSESDYQSQYMSDVELTQSIGVSGKEKQRSQERDGTKSHLSRHSASSSKISSYGGSRAESRSSKSTHSLRSRGKKKSIHSDQDAESMKSSVYTIEKNEQSKELNGHSSEYNEAQSFHNEDETETVYSQATKHSSSSRHSSRSRSRRRSEHSYKKEPSPSAHSIKNTGNNIRSIQDGSESIMESKYDPDQDGTETAITSQYDNDGGQTVINSQYGDRTPIITESMYDGATGSPAVVTSMYAGSVGPPTVVTSLYDEGTESCYSAEMQKVESGAGATYQIMKKAETVQNDVVNATSVTGPLYDTGDGTAITTSVQGDTLLIGDIGSIKNDGAETMISALKSEKKSIFDKAISSIQSDSDESAVVIISNTRHFKNSQSKFEGWRFKCIVGLIAVWFTSIICCSITVGVYYTTATRNIAETSDVRNASTELLRQIQQFQMFQNSSISNLYTVQNQSARLLSMFDSLQQQFVAVERKVQQDQQLIMTATSIGRSADSPIRSCGDLPYYFPSGNYYIRTTNDNPVRVYCNMTFTCDGVIGGWIQIIDRDFRSSGSPVCLPGLMPMLTPSARTRACIKPPSAGCTSITLNTPNVEYSRVCGKILAYQIGHVNGYSGRTSNYSRSIDGNYVDGITLTHGRESERQHIWTFVAERDSIVTDWTRGRRCPCLDGRLRDRGETPSFIDNHHQFCDTGSNSDKIPKGQFFESNLLWDGAGCTGSNQCCSFNRPPYFYRTLTKSTSNDIEMRLCTDEPSSAESIAIREMALYIR